MGKIKLVIFDMDGLLFDTEWPSYRALKQIVESKGYPFSLENYKQLIGLQGSKSQAVLKSMYGSDFEVERVIEEYHLRFKGILETEGISVKAGAETLLQALDDRGIKKCIASSSTRKTIDYYLKMTKLESYFDFYISGNEVKKGKPHPDIFLEACMRANETPEFSIVLEDSLNGLKAAHAAKVRCILVPDLIDPTDEMKEKAYTVVQDLEQVIPLVDESW
jgi:HAD superfamily hydrolase (TIGR01509 family)